MKASAERAADWVMAQLKADKVNPLDSMLGTLLAAAITNQAKENGVPPSVFKAAVKILYLTEQEYERRTAEGDNVGQPANTLAI